MTNCPRKPWLAAALSLVTPGLGHLYCGRPWRGLGLVVSSLVFIPAAFAAVVPPPSLGKLLFLIAASFAVPLIVLLAVVDAFRSALRRREVYETRRWQRLPVYAGFAVLGLLAVGSPFLLRSRAVEAFRVASESMEPTLSKGDYVLVSKLAGARDSLRRGDVIVFVVPGERKRNYVKRVIALPGDRVEVRDGRVLVNGAACAGPGVGAAPAGMPEQTVPPGHLFVLGDQVARSRDSRDIGPVPIHDVVGPVFYVLRPRGIGSVLRD